MISALLGTGHLEWQEYLVAYILGVSTIGVHIAAKTIPDKHFKWTDNFLGLEESKHDDKLNKFFNDF